MISSVILYASFVMTAITFMLQIKPLFPEYQGIIKSVLLFSFGAFVGSLLTRLSGAQFNLELTGSPLFLLVVAVQAVAAIMGFLFIFLGWHRHSGITEVQDAVTVCFLIFFGLFIYHFFAAIPQWQREADKLTYSEWVTLGGHAEATANWGRAVYDYQAALNDIPQEATANRQKMEEKIAELKKREFQVPSSPNAAQK